jgi:hypothetical protein
LAAVGMVNKWHHFFRLGVQMWPMVCAQPHGI